MSPKVPRPEDEVQAALDKLVELGCEEHMLRSLALSLAWLKTKQFEKPRHEKLLQGFDRIETELRRFAQVADSMERINEHPFLGIALTRRESGLDSPGSALFPIPTPQEQGVLNKINMQKALPDQVRLFAEDANKRIQDLRKIFHFKGGGPSLDSVKFGLINYVRKCTGQPHYDLISPLMFALGHENDVTWKEFMPENLQSFESRYRRRMQRLSKKGPDADIK
jgi:hypothetical protein